MSFFDECAPVAPVVDLVYVRDEDLPPPGPSYSEIEQALAQARATVTWCELAMADLRRGSAHA